MKSDSTFGLSLSCSFVAAAVIDAVAALLANGRLDTLPLLGLLVLMTAAVVIGGTALLEQAFVNSELKNRSLVLAKALDELSGKKALALQVFTEAEFEPVSSPVSSALVVVPATRLPTRRSSSSQSIVAMSPRAAAIQFDVSEYSERGSRLNVRA